MSWIDQRPDEAAGAFEAMATATAGGIDPAAFREAMSRLGAAVHVVTTDGPGGKGGFTATAVCALSDAPAMLLVCLNRRSRSTGPFHANGVFCVNTLRAGEEAIADAFAGRTAESQEARFTVGEWTTLSTGSPVLASAVVAFDCRIVEVKSVATHNVFIAAIEAVSFGTAGPALVYHDRAYKRV
ncbi:MAG TPA: flavin reductase [Xanthobacteraceae bacterium]|nr:flavin reductase [Xanthobacteraceae bacterium]